MSGERAIGKREYEVLAAFRQRLRHFLRFSENAARAKGLTPQQHQLLLAIKGMPGRDFAAIHELAAALDRRHHSVAELIARSEAANLIERFEDPGDRRVVLVRLTLRGEGILADLTADHRTELSRMRAEILSLSDLLSEEPGQKG